MSNFKKPTLRLRGRKGQGITEYAAVIAFVAVLVTIAFAFSQGKLGPAVSTAFSATASNVNGLASQAEQVNAAP